MRDYLSTFRHLPEPAWGVAGGRICRPGALTYVRDCSTSYCMKAYNIYRERVRKRARRIAELQAILEEHPAVKRKWIKRGYAWPLRNRAQLESACAILPKNK